VENVEELEKILKRPIKLLDITHEPIFNSGKYRTGPQAIWLIGLGHGEDEMTWMKYTGELFEDAIDCQFQEGIIKQVFGANHTRGKLVNEINYWHPTQLNAPNYQVEEVIYIDMKEYYSASMRGQEEYDITGFAQIRSFKFVPNIYLAIPIWYGKQFACRSEEGCEKAKGW
ncbi:36075_t:CDS:2, partial [Gigaspora margarita]